MTTSTVKREGKLSMKEFWKREFSINTQQLVTMALLVALDIVLSRFGSINLWNTRIGFGFVPIVVAGMLLGPTKAAVTAAVADIIGALLVPTGAFFPGLTVTAVLRGILYGVLLKVIPELTAAGDGILSFFAAPQEYEAKYKRDWLFLAIGTTLIDQLAFGMLLQSYWLSILYGSPYGGMMVSRVPQIAILIPVEFVVLVFLPRLTEKLKPMLKSGKKK